MTGSHIEYESLGSTARIWHNRPESSNAEGKQLLDELDEAMTRAEQDEDVRVIIIGGRGKHFSAGHDIREGQAERSQFTVEQRYDFESKYYYDYSLRIWDCPKPTIAQVQGACIAGGFMVANMCDLMIVSEDAFFSDPVVRTMSAAAVEILVHPWVMGSRRAREFLYTGKRITAREAYEWGMANRIVPLDGLDAAALAFADEIAVAPPFAVKLTKRSLNRTLDMQGFRNAIKAHFDTHQLSHATAETAALRAKGFSTKG